MNEWAPVASGVTLAALPRRELAASAWLMGRFAILLDVSRLAVVSLADGDGRSLPRIA